MKILRTGPPWALKCECRSCRSLLLIDISNDFQEEDITLEPTPNCGNSYLIEDLPAYVKDLARSKAKWNVGQ